MPLTLRTQGGLNVTADVCGPCQHHGHHAGPIPSLPVPSSTPPSPHSPSPNPHPDTKGWLQIYSLRMCRPSLKTPSFPPGSAVHFSNTCPQLKMVALCRGFGHAQGLAGSDHALVSPAQGVWVAGQARTGTSLHPAELKQHPPLKEEVDTSSALLDHNRCLAPGFVLL